ncbi:MAG TPA: carbohydrate ABC transporter permease [Rectinema sp.]|nr:carbohydrate ABC transporter permease [Rectinema sp.]HOO02621.1 carbohydrate ABC transporter permease [Rectinema sp.]HOU61523.1 carbohydrate ABC transporter permease [Rectinema sp.]HPD69847.1 carbohydrate ABC transporter permease [Rectinema sp.]HQG15557.1 carbohydrate ABC transporter permease [Rectinema sp.]
MNKKGKISGNSSKKPLSNLLVHLILIVICVAWIIPSLGLFVSSFRPRSEIALSGWWQAFQPPFAFTLENYSYVLTRGNMGRSFVNSLLIAIPSTLMPIFIAACAAYALAWMRFPLRKTIHLLIVALIVVPLQMTMIPILRLFNKIGLTGSFLGIWLAHTAYGLPFAIYLLRNFIVQLPRSLIESAQIDGASHPIIFLRLVLPTSIPAISSLAIFQFMWVWNDLLVALIYLGGTPNVAPMTVTISNMVNSYGGGWEYLTAAAFISMLLPLIVFFALQKYFVRGILAGSVKG